jgi:rhodanese-related sulfurtransferase
MRPAAAVLMVASLVACSLGRSPVIQRETLAAQIAAGTGPLVLDVRSGSEYDAGHVPGAINLPFQSVASRHEELAVAAGAPIVVYCAHGPRAAWAGRALRKAGYTHVLYLDGHMTAWKKAGLPTEATPTAADPESATDRDPSR